MRVRDSACLLCRHVLTTPQSSTGRSFLSSARMKQYYDFVLSPLILELDAADSKYVRRFEELDDDEKLGMFGSEYLKQNIQDPRSSTSTADTESVKSRSTQRATTLNTRVVTTPDILEFVLSGDSCRATHIPYLPRPVRSTKHLKHIYKEKNIQPYNQVHHNAQNLLYKRNAGQWAPFVTHKEDEIKADLSQCKDFASLRRTTSLVCQTTSGRNFLAKNGASIVYGTKSTLQQKPYIIKADQEISEVDILSYLNNLCLNLSSHLRANPIDIGPDFCHSGIYYASKAFNLPAVNVYLRIAIENSYSHKAYTHLAVKNLCLALEKQKYPDYQKSWNSWRSDDWRRTDVLRLLTGWDSGGVPTVGETRQPCFATLIASGERSYMHYVLALGRIGARDALWHEWNFPVRSRQNRSQEVQRKTAEMFITALLVAKDRPRALLIRDSLNAPMLDESIEKVPGSDDVAKLLRESISGVLVDEVLQELEKQPRTSV